MTYSKKISINPDLETQYFQTNINFLAYDSLYNS